MKETRFAFGKNWEKFIRDNFSPERVESSKSRMLEFLRMTDLQGKTFLDVGCGSGIHSLAALQAGASSVISFDVDIDSVRTTEHLKAYAGNPENWKIQHGSILDPNFLLQIQPADIVYSWGVLHHTGSMWQAFRNTVDLMQNDGIFYVALYTDEPYFGKPKDFWLGIKQSYNQQGWFGKKKMEMWYFWEFYLQKKWSAFPDLIRQARDYQSRGMAFYTDAVDWLGGWPMEVASVDQVIEFAVNDCGLELIHLGTGQANAEYLFKKKSP